MRKINVLFAVFVVLGLSAWLIASDWGGYTSRNAMIMTRSSSIVSTIDGEVVDVAVAVGSKVSAGSLLAIIQNDRIDRSRLTELRSRLEFLKSEVAVAEAQNVDLSDRIQRFSARALAYQNWITKDLKLTRRQIFHRLKAAETNVTARLAEVERTKALYRKSHVRLSALQKAKSNATVEQQRVDELKAELARIDLRIKSMKASGVLQENGNTSYWEAVGNTLELRLLDNRRQIATMTAKLTQIEAQILVEKERVGKTFAEEHRVQFDGIVNAVLASEGERVIAGANLIEVLDCANPIAIVSVPEHRFGDFHIGQKATIRPLDSKEKIIGAVQHISNEALIRRDTSIAAAPGPMASGNKVIVAFQNQARDATSSASCDTARRAAVTIETDTTLGRLSRSVMRLFAGSDRSDAAVNQKSPKSVMSSQTPPRNHMLLGLDRRPVDATYAGQGATSRLGTSSPIRH